jgi:hypothetical protein
MALSELSDPSSYGFCWHMLLFSPFSSSFQPNIRLLGCLRGPVQDIKPYSPHAFPLHLNFTKSVYSELEKLSHLAKSFV